MPAHATRAVPFRTECLGSSLDLRKRSTAGKVQIPERQLPILRRDELVARQGFGADKIGAREVGAIEDGLEESGAFEMGADQRRVAQIGSPQVRLAEIGAGKVDADKVQAMQMRLGEIRLQIRVSCSPPVPRAYSVLQPRQLCLVDHGLFLHQHLRLSRMNCEASLKLGLSRRPSVATIDLSTLD